MKNLLVLALVALIASCHFDKLFSGSGETPFSHYPPAGLVFGAGPGNAQAGQPLNPIVVTVVDSAGTRVAGADTLITIALGAGPSGASLGGTPTLHAVNGAARFADLTIDKPGTGYTLTASVAGLKPDTSAAFDVIPGPPTTGDLTVTTTTGGTGTDPNGYSVTVDGTSKPIATNGSVPFTGLPAGDHTVGLNGVASNCVVSGQNPRTVNIPAGSAQQTDFAITCSPPPNLPPTAAFTSSCPALTCTFTSTSSDPDGTIASQQWDFGDGTTGSGATPSHAYGTVRAYTVTLTVMDNAGATDVVSHDVTPGAPPPPSLPPIVDAGGDQKVLLSLLSFTLHASFTDPDGDGPWSYTIDWGDGTGSTTNTITSQGSISATHRYPAGLLRDYNLRVTVKDSHGNSGTGSATISVVLL